MEKEENHSFVHQPHDKLVKRLLASPATARDILSLFLPEKILSMTDLSTLELQRDSFIDDEHRANAVDLLYKTQFNNSEGYIWLLLEHQRKSDYWMPVRLFKYMALIMDHIRKTSASLDIPLIYPLVIYNGDRAYEHSLNLSNLIQPEEAREIFHTLFSKPFCLIDLTTIPDETLRQAASEKIRGIALLMSLKHIFDEDLQSFFEHTLVDVLKQLDFAGDTDEVVDIVYYLLNEGEFPDKTRFWMTFEHGFSEETERKMTTIAQDLIQKGWKQGLEQGLEQGMVQGLVQTARRLFQENKLLSSAELIALVHRITDLPVEQLKMLLASETC